MIASEPGKPALNSYIPYTQSKDALTWTDRSRSWSRLVSTAGVGVPALRQSLKFLCDDLSLRYPLDVEDSSIISEPATATVDASKDWSTRLYTSTRAVFGHVLAEAPTPLDLSLRHNYNPELERVFVPVIPPLQHLNQLAPNLGSHTITNGLIVIRLMPNPVQTKLPKSFAAPKSSESAPGEEPNSLPPLELRLLSGREHVDHIVSLRALHETFRRDVLLPWNPVDVRMEQTRYYELAGCKISPDHPAAAVLDFCRDADLSVAKGKLRTPARLPGLRLPRWLLTHDPAPLIADGTSYELIELDYLFMGLEVQNSAVADYNGFALAYTSVEGGKRGGSRVELSVETKPTVPPSAPLPVNPQDPSGPLRPSTTLDHQASRAAVDAAFEAAFQDTLQDEYPQAQAAFDEGPVELGKSTAGGVDMSNARFRPEQASATTPASLEAPAVSPDVETGVSVETAALRTVSSDGTSPAAAAVDSSFDAAHPPEQANASHGVNPAALASAPSASPAPSSTTGASEPTVRPVLATNLSTRDREESSITANKNEACADHDADPAAGDGHTLPPESKLAISEPSARRAFMMAVSSIVYSGKAIRWTGDNK